MKLNIITCDPYDIERDGKKYAGYNCDAVKSDNNVIRFSTSVDHTDDIVEVDDFDASKAIELDIKMSVWGGKRKYKEVVDSL